MNRIVTIAVVVGALSVSSAIQAAPFSPSLAKAISRGTGMSLPDANRLVRSYESQGATFKREAGHDKTLISDSSVRFDVIVCNFTNQVAYIDVAPDVPRQKPVNPKTCSPFAGIPGLTAVGAGPGHDQDWNGAYLYRRAPG